MAVFKEIIVPTDFSDHSLRALEYAVEMAQRFNATLKLIYVIEPFLQAADLAWTTVNFEEILRSHESAATEQLEKLVSERVPTDVSVDTVVVKGKPFVEIVKFAKKENADLIVMATHGRGAISHLLLGSTTEKVVRKAPCPVLTVRHPKHLFAMP